MLLNVFYPTVPICDTVVILAQPYNIVYYKSPLKDYCKYKNKKYKKKIKKYKYLNMN